MEELRQRMYCIVLRQLNPIQKGVQMAHAIVEYSNNFGDTPEWKRWAETDKTIVMLDGGTYPELTHTAAEFEVLGVNLAHFEEDDLNCLTTCVCLLADERVWDYKKWPSWDRCPSSPTQTFPDGTTVMLGVYMEPEKYEHYVERMGGEPNVKLRETLRNMHMAQ